MLRRSHGDLIVTHTQPAPVTCACGATTIGALAHLDPDGTVRSCWVALADDGRARPGCVPDQRTPDVVYRRNRRLDEEAAPPRPRPSFTGGTLVRCACSRTTRVLTSNFSTLTDRPEVADPPDPSVPFGSTTCWLAIDASDGGPAAGCAPDERTWDVLARSRGIAPPSHAVTLEDVRPAPPPPPRAAASEPQAPLFGDAVAVAPATEPEPAPPDDGPVELSLFG
jgi:hypothetical protein